MPSQTDPPQTSLPEQMQQFLQLAVHDLRAAKRRTGIAAELLLETGNEVERNELAAEILQGLTQTEHLLTYISKYATALAPERYSITCFPASSAVRFALANLDPEIRASGATVKVADLPEITGDRERIADLFEHLVGNALKFRSQAPPEIEIAAERSPEGWLFSIKDNGIGIPEKYRDRLFQPFRRLVGADVPGAGLGLAISRKIVEGHGGTIFLDAASGNGVTLLFSLPGNDGDERASSRSIGFM